MKRREHLSLYLNIDPGVGPIYGWYSEESAAAKSLFDAWLAPLKDLGGRRNVIAGITNTDHLSFKAVGIPAHPGLRDLRRAHASHQRGHLRADP